MLRLLVTLIVVGFLLYLAETYIPMSPPVKAIVRVVVLLLLLFWVLQLLGLWVGSPVL